MESPTFVLILSPGRSGSTLLMRLLNAVPGVKISGENNKALDHLHSLVNAMEDAKRHHHSEFYKIAWASPCARATLIESARDFALKRF